MRIQVTSLAHAETLQLSVLQVRQRNPRVQNCTGSPVSEVCLFFISIYTIILYAIIYPVLTYICTGCDPVPGSLSQD